MLHLGYIVEIAPQYGLSPLFQWHSHVDHSFLHKPRGYLIAFNSGGFTLYVEPLF